MEDNKATKTKGSAYSQPAYIKPKSKWTKKATIWTIVIVVIILVVLAIIGLSNGWFKSADQINGKIELDDYSVIDINESDITVSDETIDSYLNNIISSETTYETVEEGTVEDGDTINLNYSGVLEGEEEPFDGGTAEDQSLTIGSGTMIDGFESQIIGHEIGETFDINVTFPEDYSSEDLAGKNAVFTITVNSKTITNVPELTDELVQEYTAENFDEQINSIEELKEYYRTTLEESYLESAILSAMQEKTHITYYNEADLAMMKTYNASALSYYASMYGMDAATLAQLYGFDSEEAYAEDEAKSTLTTTMMLDKVAEEQNITVTDEEMDAALEEYRVSENYDGTLDEFKAESGESFLFLVRETEVLMPKVIEYLKGNVNIIPAEETEENADEESAEENAETTAAEAAAEETTAVEESSVEETTAAEESSVEETTAAEESSAEETTAEETTAEETAAAEESSAAETVETTAAAK